MKRLFKALWADKSLLLVLVPVVVLATIGIAKLGGNAEMDEAGARNATSTSVPTTSAGGSEGAAPPPAAAAGGDVPGSGSPLAFTDDLGADTYDPDLVAGDAPIAPASERAVPPAFASAPADGFTSAPLAVGATAAAVPGTPTTVAGTPTTVSATPTTVATTMPGTPTTTPPDTSVTTTTVVTNPPAPVDESPVVALMPVSVALLGGAGYAWARRRIRRMPA